MMLYYHCISVAFCCHGNLTSGLNQRPCSTALESKVTYFYYDLNLNQHAIPVLISAITSRHIDILDFWFWIYIYVQVTVIGGNF